MNIQNPTTKILVTKNGVVRHYGVVIGPGNVAFRSARALCEHYNVSPSTYARLRAQGYTPCEAVAFHGVVGPGGWAYRSVAHMCKAYGVQQSFYEKELEKGLSMEEALKAAAEDSKTYGPDGEEYRNVSALCMAYGVQQATYIRRLARGWTQKQALGLEKAPKKQHQVRDFNGKRYVSVEEMCSAFGITKRLYSDRIRLGYTKREALTTPKHEHVARLQKVQCFNGKKYLSVEEMCENFGVTKRLYNDRIRMGYTQEEALTTPKRGHIARLQKIKCFDGKRYTDEKEMCNAFGITFEVYKDRCRNGQTQQEALTAPEEELISLVGPDGKKYVNSRELCKAYGADLLSYMHRRLLGDTVKEALGI